MLVVVAHPDDETFGTGSVIAHAAVHGVDVARLVPPWTDGPVETGLLDPPLP